MHLSALLGGHLLILGFNACEMLVSLGLQPSNDFVFQHFLLHQHQVSSLEDVQATVTAFEMGRGEQSLLIAAENELVLLTIVARPPLKEIELAGDRLAFAVGKFGYIFERDEHVLSHYCLLTQSVQLSAT